MIITMQVTTLMVNLGALRTVTTKVHGTAERNCTNPKGFIRMCGVIVIVIALTIAAVLVRKKKLNTL